jgi:hypothetical protein
MSQTSFLDAIATLSAASAIIGDQPDLVEITVKRLGEYALDAISFVGHTAYDHPNEFVIAVFTAVLAIATIKLWRATNSLWEAGERQLKHLEQTAERQLRAYVFVSSAKVDIHKDSNAAIEAIVVLRNFGSTPASNVINVSGFAVSPYPVTSMPDMTFTDQSFAAAGQTRLALPPGVPSVSPVPIAADPRYSTGEAKSELVAGLSNGTLIVFVYGEIRYTDIFGKARWTQYRFMMGGPVGFRDGLLVGCGEGNEAT